MGELHWYKGDVLEHQAELLVIAIPSDKDIGSTNALSTVLKTMSKPLMTQVMDGLETLRAGAVQQLTKHEKGLKMIIPLSDDELLFKEHGFKEVCFLTYPALDDDAFEKALNSCNSDKSIVFSFAGQGSRSSWVELIEKFSANRKGDVAVVLHRRSRFYKRNEYYIKLEKK